MDSILELTAKVQELNALAEYGRSKTFLSSIASAEMKCKVLSRSFCGSWLGYHSRLYFGEFSPVSGDAAFSVEWGLMDRFSNSSSPEWKEFDSQTVREFIFDGDDDFSEDICRTARESWEAFVSIRLEVNSILEYIESDSFLKARCEELNELNLKTVSEFLKEWKPQALAISRDSRAYSEGFKIPEHVRVRAEIASLQYVFELCTHAERIVKQIASHLGRKPVQTHVVAEPSTSSKQYSKKVMVAGKDALLSAFKSKQKGLILKGEAFNSEPEMTAMNLEIAEYCRQNGWIRNDASSKFHFILSQSGIEYAKSIMRESRELKVQLATLQILEKAEENNWNLDWVEHDSGSLVQFNNVPLSISPEDLDILTEACHRMVNESGFMEKVEGTRYRITKMGRHALIDGSMASLAGEPEMIVSETKKEFDPELVFVVHGRDGDMRQSVELFLHQVGLKPVVLFKQTSGGRFVMEKFEYYANKVGFAVVILTPEDYGSLREEYSSDGKAGVQEFRARQNVVFEMGFFFALLGRGKVVALRQGAVSKPSDIDGIVYVEIKDRFDSNWKLELAKEMDAAGLRVNFAKI